MLPFLLYCHPSGKPRQWLQVQGTPFHSPSGLPESHFNMLNRKQRSTSSVLPWQIQNKIKQAWPSVTPLFLFLLMKGQVCLLSQPLLVMCNFCSSKFQAWPGPDVTRDGGCFELLMLHVMKSGRSGPGQAMGGWSSGLRGEGGMMQST